MASFIISTGNPAFKPDGKLNESVQTSARRARAKRHARRLQKDGNKFVILFEVKAAGMQPISFKPDHYRGGVGRGCNSWPIEMPEGEESRRKVLGRKAL